MRRAIFFFPPLLFMLVGWISDLAPTPYSFPRLNYFPPMPVSPSNPVTAEGAELGRYLFYDPVLSADSTISCSSCHKQEFAFSDAPNKFSLGIGGQAMKRNTMPLFNLAWYSSFFWDGRAASLEEQVFRPVQAHDEMNLRWPEAVKRISRSDFYPEKFSAAFGPQTIDSVLIAKAIAQFERTLISHDSKYDRVLRGEAAFTEDEYDGLVLVNEQHKGDCLHCHTTDADALGTTGKFSNNGLDTATYSGNYRDAGRGAVTGNIKEYGAFKIPSLRNVGLTAPYMHDGRFQTLEEVVDFYGEGVKTGVNTDSKMEFAHRGGNRLTAEERKKVVAFLHTLTDSTFISDPEFGNPFRAK